MSEFEDREHVRREVARERAAHEARARAEVSDSDASGAAGQWHPAEVAEPHSAQQAEPHPALEQAYRPALTEQVLREQAEVDAMLLGHVPVDTTPPHLVPSEATPSSDMPPTDLPAPDLPAPDLPAPDLPAPDPGTRVPSVGELPAVEDRPQVVPHGRRRGWATLGGTAATAALLASLGTAAVTGAFEAPPTAPTTTAAPAVVPASSTSASPDWEAVTSAVRESVVALDVATGSGDGQGSGVVLDTDGHILTNSHVVADARSVSVTLADGRLHEAEPVGQDETTDLAVVRLVDPPEDLAPATLGSSADVAVGESVLAVGNPLGLDSTATTGIVSALDRPVVTQSRTESVVTNAIQIDAAVNPGNSGGPVFDARGEVIGITSSIASLSSGGAAGSIGLGFAIPVDQAADAAQQLIENGEVEHAFLGVGLSDTPAEADGVTRAGAGIEQVESGSPADEAGLRTGDVVTAIDDRSVDGAAALTGYVRQYSSGDTATLSVVRDGSLEQVDVTLAAREVPA